MKQRPDFYAQTDVYEHADDLVREEFSARDRSGNRSCHPMSCWEKFKASCWVGSLKFLGAGGLLLVLVGASYGPNLTHQEYEQIKKQLSQISQGEYQRLQRNLQAYQQMSADEQQKYNELHRVVAERRLSPLVEEYSNWLETLNPLERQRLRNTSEPAARIAVVEEILKKKREEEEYRLPELMARMIEQGESSFRDLRWVLQPQQDLNFEHPYVLTNSQIDTLLDQIFLPQLSEVQQKLFGPESGAKRTERISQILRASISHLPNPRENWPSDEAFASMESLGIQLKGEPPENVTRAGGRGLTPEQWRRLAFRRLLIRSLVVVQLQELERKYPVSSKELLDYFAKLHSPSQAILLDSPADYQAEALKWHYLWNTHRNETFLHQSEFRDYVLRELVSPWSMGERGGPGGRPQTGRGPRGRSGEFPGPDGGPPGGPPPPPPRVRPDTAVQ